MLFLEDMRDTNETIITDENRQEKNQISSAVCIVCHSINKR
jgi:hypothetical protein